MLILKFLKKNKSKNFFSHAFGGKEHSQMLIFLLLTTVFHTRIIVRPREVESKFLTLKVIYLAKM
ncbi:MAG: hypothetical protein DKM22_00570 [Candidatus Melainabacteria bacterium]|nr:MAG: hypothetical protein DKM22_00570 [Candidatus Melainabacteria bacterium]